jgi:hypothetical protein
MDLAVRNKGRLHAHLRSSIDRAARFIVDMQAKSGAWTDFDLEVGLSDEWTTGYIGVCLLEVEPCVTASERRYLRIALEGAADFLQSSRRSDGTWGYNANVPSDSDSTSWAALFLTAMGRSPDAQTYGALRTFARADGGFATFNAQKRDGARSTWECSHPDVTPVALCALAASSPESVVSEETLSFILAHRDVNGLWNSYWYRTALYATLHNLIALRRAGRMVAPPATAVIATMAATHDPFELALALEIVTRFAVAGETRTFVLDAAAALLASQSREGWWVAEPLMRVTYQSLERPWELPGDAGGPLYNDEYFTFTTATVARALSLLVRERQATEEDTDGKFL